jgi:hypothetical protein
MATLKGNVLGKIRGKVGTVSGRVRNGKNYLVSLPASFNTPTDPLSIARREKFKMAVLFSKAVYNNSLLKSIWIKQNTENRTAFNLVMRKNYKLLENNSPSTQNIITPELGFNPNYSSAGYSDGDVTIVTNNLSDTLTIDPAIETRITATGFIFAEDPNSGNVELYNFYNFSASPQAIDLAQPMTFTVTLPYIQKMQLENYQSIKIYSALITLNDDLLPVQYSLTSVN